MQVRQDKADGESHDVWFKPDVPDLCASSVLNNIRTLVNCESELKKNDGGTTVSERGILCPLGGLEIIPQR